MFGHAVDAIVDLCRGERPAERAAVVPADVRPAGTLTERRGQQVASDAGEESHGDQRQQERAAATPSVARRLVLVRRFALINHAELLLWFHARGGEVTRHPSPTPYRRGRRVAGTELEE